MSRNSSDCISGTWSCWDEQKYRSETVQKLTWNSSNKCKRQRGEIYWPGVRGPGAAVAIEICKIRWWIICNIQWLANKRMSNTWSRRKVRHSNLTIAKEADQGSPRKNLNTCYHITFFCTWEKVFWNKKTPSHVFLYEVLYLVRRCYKLLKVDCPPAQMKPTSTTTGKHECEWVFLCDATVL